MHIGKKINKAIDGEKPFDFLSQVLLLYLFVFFICFTFTMISLVLRARCAADLFSKHIRKMKKRSLPRPITCFNGSVRGFHFRLAGC